MSEGWQGWDQYAPFYDWENARTVARRDVGFWQALARRRSGAVLELGCGTGRLAIPLMKSGARLVGIDRSEAMLGRLRMKARRAGLIGRGRFVRGDIRRLPFRARPGFGLVLAPYGMLQSLTRERDLAETLKKLNLSGLISPADLQAKINAGLDRLNDLKHDDGGWGWWKEDDSRVFMTSYVVSGLAQAKAAGYAKAEDLIAYAYDPQASTQTWEKLMARALRGGDVTLRNIRMDKAHFRGEVAMLLDAASRLGP